MNKRIFQMLALPTLLAAFSVFVHAQAQRTFVSAQRGNDANTASLCSVTNPCRGFAAAISVVASGGEVIALDSGGYGAVTITKAVQITAPTGVYVAITAASGTAITIDAGATDVVVLRGLTLNSVNLSASGGGSGAGIGINFNTGKAVYIESCVINGFLDYGIFFNAAGALYAKDTIVRNTGADGIAIYTDSGVVTATLDHCTVARSGRYGFNIVNNARVTISNSIAAGSASTGFLVSGSGRLTVSNSTAANNGIGGGFGAVTGAQMNVESCIAEENFYGMIAEGTGTVMRVSNSMAVNNNYGFYQLSSALFESRGNNTVRGNASSNVVGAITIIGGN